MKFSKRKPIYSLILVLILSFSFILASYFNSSNQLAIREIDVDSIGTLSYEEKARQILNDFDMYSYEFNDNVLSFNGEITRSANYFNGFDYLSTSTNEQITQKYSTYLDLEEERFVLTISYYHNNEFIEKTEQETTPIFDSEKNDYFIKLDNGELLSVSKIINDNNMDNCIALVDDAAILLAIALTIAVVAAAPYIINVVSTVVTQVTRWISSFFWWLKSLFVETVVTTVVTQVATPAITIDNTTYRTEAKTKTDLMHLDPTLYFGAFADPTNGKMYLTVIPIGEIVAIAILATPIVVPCIGDTSRTMIASTYTFTEIQALKIASVVGLHERTPAWSPEIHGKRGYFWHYHTVASAITLGKGGVRYVSNPHSFYGLPI